MKNFKPNQNFVFYLYWICERMDIFWKRQRGEKPPYTTNEILSTYKFTNVYRSLDRVSQYLLKNVIYNGKQYDDLTMFWRILLFKHFNSNETWELLIGEFGDITLDVGFAEIEDFLLKQKQTIYSNAYIVTCHFYQNEKYKHLKGTPKVHAYFDIFKKEIIGNGYVEKLLEAPTMEELFNRLVKLDIYGGFMAMQYTIDFNYSNLFNFSENDFIVAGVGAKRGIERTFDITGKPDYEKIIGWVTENFEQLLSDFSKAHDLPLEFKSLPNRMPQLIDIQNCFCETDKFMRGMGVVTQGVKVKGKRIKNTFTQSSKGDIDYVFPPKWGVKSL